jgi:long-chain acyl-CoA synthetase
VVSRGPRLVALVYMDADKISEEAVDLDEYKKTIIIEVNKSMPVYSKIGLVEVMDKPFEKTPKMSIKRFMYK